MRITLLLVIAACGSPQATPPGDDDPIDAGDEPAIDGAAMVACEGKQAQPPDATWMIQVGSRMRVARVHVPATYDPATRTPLVVDLHGRTQTAIAQARLSAATTLADSEGFIVIQPESATSPTSWNAGTCCDPATTNQLDDVGFVRALLDEAEARLCIDTARVYAQGMSNGGYLSHRLGCELADRFAAIGPVAGLLLFSGCAPVRPVPVMMVNGTADSLSQYQFVDEAIDFWRAHNQCTTMTTTYATGDATCVTHGGCAEGADVVLCTIADGGHQWPGSTETFPFLGKKSDDLATTSALWGFFSTHTR
jgi:polyhydroxybutyrate depolymerase